MPYCKKCGEELPKDAEFCPNCGTSVTKPTPIKIAPKQVTQVRPSRVVTRPIPVSVAAILFFIFGGLGVALGAIAMALGLPLIGTVGYVFALGLIAFVLAAAELEAGYGVWKMRKWGAVLGVILSVLSLVTNTISTILTASYIDLLLSVASDVPILIILVFYWRSFQ